MNQNSPSKGYDPDLYKEPARKARFKRVAERRTNRILENLRLLGNTGNKNLYAYTPDDIDKIFGAIEKSITETRAKFKTKKGEPFSLDSDR